MLYLLTYLLTYYGIAKNNYSTLSDGDHHCFSNFIFDLSTKVFLLIVNVGSISTIMTYQSLYLIWCVISKMTTRDGWLVGCWGFTTVPVTKTIRLSEWVTPGDTAIPGMTSLKDRDRDHFSFFLSSTVHSLHQRSTVVEIIIAWIGDL